MWRSDYGDEEEDPSWDTFDLKRRIPVKHLTGAATEGNSLFRNSPDRGSTQQEEATIMAKTMTKTAAKKSTAHRGEARRSSMGYKHGEPMKDGTILEKGKYALELVDSGKEGDKGWKIATSGWPSRAVKFIAQGTEDEASGNEVAIRHTINTNPSVFFQVHGLAQAANYEKDLDFGDLGDPEEPGDPQTRIYRKWIDGLLSHIKAKGIIIQAEIAPEEWQGRTSNRVKRFYPADEGEISEAGEETEETETEEGEETSEETEEGSEGEETEETEGEEETAGHAASECEANTSYRLPSGKLGEFLGIKNGKARFKLENDSVVSVPESETVTPVDADGDAVEEEEEEEATEEAEAEEDAEEAARPSKVKAGNTGKAAKKAATKPPVKGKKK